MALVLTEDQRMLREAAKGFFADTAPVDAFRDLRDAGDVYSPDLWEQMVELGWAAVAVPEEHDGLDFGITGLGLIAIEAGRNLVASPLMTTAAVGASTLVLGNSDEARKSLLPAIASGGVFVSLAIDEDNHHDMAAIEVIAKRNDGGFVLDGSKLFVAEGNYADYFVVVARESDERDAAYVLLLVDASAEGVSRRRVQLMDSRDYANVEFSGVTVSKEHVLAEGEEAKAVVQKLVDIATVITACELYGCAQQTFEQTVQYLTEREQFGQVIGTFQALQHRAAHAYSQLQLLKSVVLDALDAVEKGRPDLPIAASHAKALANDTAQLVTNEGIQMHGGIGVTDELDIGLYFKRVRVLRNMFGNSSYHRRRFASLAGY